MFRRVLSYGLVAAFVASGALMFSVEGAAAKKHHDDGDQFHKHQHHKHHNDDGFDHHKHKKHFDNDGGDWSWDHHHHHHHHHHNGIHITIG